MGTLAEARYAVRDSINNVRLARPSERHKGLHDAAVIEPIKPPADKPQAVHALPPGRSYGLWRCAWTAQEQDSGQEDATEHHGTGDDLHCQLSSATSDHHARRRQ